MFTSYILSVFSIAGFTVLWRKILHDFPVIGEQLSLRLPVVGKAFTCGLCFTYWISLFFVLWYNPVPNWTGTLFAFHLFLSWMVVAFGAVFLRFLYVSIQELVHYQVHHLRGEHHH